MENKNEEQNREQSKPNDDTSKESKSKEENDDKKESEQKSSETFASSNDSIKLRVESSSVKKDIETRDDGNEEDNDDSPFKLQCLIDVPDYGFVGADGSYQEPF